jgi:hypothetical protein
MNSPIAALFIGLQEKIASLTATVGGELQPCFKYVDQDFGQLDNQGAGSRPSVAWPCALIEFDDFVYSAISQNCQASIGNIIISIGFPPISGSSNLTPDEYREKAIYYYELENLLHSALQGWMPSAGYPAESVPEPLAGFGALNRTNSRTRKRKDTIRVREITYSIGFEDYSTKPATTTAPATLNLSITVPPTTA